MDEHRLVPRDAQLQLRVGESDPHQDVDHPLTVVVVGDGRQELVERLDCHGFTLGDKHAGQPHIGLCLSTRVQIRGPPVVFHRQPPGVERLALYLVELPSISKGLTTVEVVPTCKV